MCGIIGTHDAAPRLVEGLRRLEYRGYDSAGVATLVKGGIETPAPSGPLPTLHATPPQAHPPPCAAPRPPPRSPPAA
ncbi:hypothetical protein GAY28_32435, partial [Azospirillum brasilense]|nr:hypothetical protein [Azospirillum brasilense]